MQQRLGVFKQEVRLRLQELASDPRVPLCAKRHQVQELLAAWHPSGEAARCLGPAAGEVHAFAVAEVNRLLAGGACYDGSDGGSVTGDAECAAR